MDEARTDLMRGQVGRWRGTSRVPGSRCVNSMSALALLPLTLGRNPPVQDREPVGAQRQLREVRGVADAHTRQVGHLVI